MRLVQYSVNSDPSKRLRVGFRKDDSHIEALETECKSLREVLQNEPNLLVDVELQSKSRHKNEEVTLHSPITDCDKVICLGMNYKDHCEEQNCPVPLEPIFFSKFASCIVGPNDPIPYPEATKELDYEVELAVVIGKKGKNIPKEKAMDFVLGYTVAHDVSARDWQLKRNGGQWLIGKAMDAFCPLGPEIVTKEDIPDPHNLAIKCRVNGATKQDSNTNQIVHRIDAVVSKMSFFVTLLPGDVILTGTPPGVGVFAKPPFFLKKGDVVECEIEKIGTIRNAII